MKNLLKYAFALGGALALAASSAQALTFVPVNANIAADTLWTNDKVYILNRVIFVEPGATLTIEAGTLIRGIDSTQSGLALEPGALVVTRGAKICANGVPELPIIFTAIDDPNVPGGALTIPASFMNSQGGTLTNGVDYGLDDWAPDGTATNDNAFAFVARWGGLAVLGRGYCSQGTAGVNPTAGPPNGSPTYGAGSLVLGPARNDATSVGQDYLEGVEPGSVPGSGGPTFFGAYGGVDDLDDSGVMRFVQCRYAGFDLGGPNGNELNSITIGAPGLNFKLEWFESFANQDDGFEWFGGVSNARYLFAHYIKDDSFDGDEGSRLDLQFCFAMQGSSNLATRAGWPNGAANGTVVVVEGSNNYDHMFEFDGPEPNIATPANTGKPLTQINAYNCTLLTECNDEVYRIRERANANLINHNVVFRRSASALLEITADNTNIGDLINGENIHYFRDGNGLFDNLGLTWDLINGTEETALSVIGNGIYTAGGVDARIPAGSTARTEDGPATPGVTYPSAEAVTTDTGTNLAPVTYAGFQRDNKANNGWTALSALGVVTGPNLARPDITRLNVVGGSYEVTFTDAVAGVIYIVDFIDTDKCPTYAVRVSDGGAGDLDAAAGTIRVATGIAAAPGSFRVTGL